MKWDLTAMSEHQLLTIEDGLMKVSPDAVKDLVIHCSDTRCDRDYTAEQLLRDHKERDFRTVVYHFYIHRDSAQPPAGSRHSLPSLKPLQHRHLLRGRTG